ncbi:MAG TPA: sigma-54 dependent transcriptional regulator [Candidatus Hydrogenedens sp.]|nr:sigma-54 dependent transcriptional regulator [Candidatus Hydrogenedens sp.]
MEKEILFNIWKEVASHNKIDNFISNIMPEVKKFLPSLENIDIFIFNKQLNTLELLPTPNSKITHKNNHFTVYDSFNQDIEELIKMREIVQGSSKHRKSNLTKIFSFFYEQELLPYAFLAPLYMRNSIEGLMICVLRKNYPINERTQAVLSKLIEPFSVALANHKRIIELETLRKAEEAEKMTLLRKLGRESYDDHIIGEKTGLKFVLERVKLVANSDLPVLILGETGTGKELIARAIHKNSNRSQGPIIRVNCGAIPPELIDSQLFGHEKGSFTGAVEKHSGWFERADGGTLFLDEIGELPLNAQVRLLRILQDGWFERVGGKEPIHVDVRLVAATNADLARLVIEKKFREDLFYRISTFPIVLPPLRERKEDIPEMAKYFAEKSAQRFSLPVVYPTELDIELLCQYTWPGNVRELASVIDRAAILGNGKKLDIEHALGQYTIKKAETNQKDSQKFEILPLDEFNKNYLEYILKITNGKIDGKGGCAELLQINANTLRAKIKKLGLNINSFKQK